MRTNTKSLKKRQSKVRHFLIIAERILKLVLLALLILKQYLALK
jgi:hypothetical protein